MASDKTINIINVQNNIINVQNNIINVQNTVKNVQNTFGSSSPGSSVPWGSSSSSSQTLFASSSSSVGSRSLVFECGPPDQMIEKLLTCRHYLPMSNLVDFLIWRWPLEPIDEIDCSLHAVSFKEPDTFLTYLKKEHPDPEENTEGQYAALLDKLRGFIDARDIIIKVLGNVVSVCYPAPIGDLFVQCGLTTKSLLSGYPCKKKDTAPYPYEKGSKHTGFVFVGPPDKNATFQRNAIKLHKILELSLRTYYEFPRLFDLGQPVTKALDYMEILSLVSSIKTHAGLLQAAVVDPTLRKNDYRGSLHLAILLERTEIEQLDKIKDYSEKRKFIEARIKILIITKKDIRYPKRITNELNSRIDGPYFVGLEEEEVRNLCDKPRSTPLWFKNSVYLPTDLSRKILEKGVTEDDLLGLRGAPPERDYAHLHSVVVLGDPTRPERIMNTHGGPDVFENICKFCHLGNCLPDSCPEPPTDLAITNSFGPRPRNQAEGTASGRGRGQPKKRQPTTGQDLQLIIRQEVQKALKEKEQSSRLNKKKEKKKEKEKKQQTSKLQEKEKEKVEQRDDPKGEDENNGSENEDQEVEVAETFAALKEKKQADKAKIAVLEKGLRDESEKSAALEAGLRAVTIKTEEMLDRLQVAEATAADATSTSQAASLLAATTNETSQAAASLAQQAADTAQALQARLEETEGKVVKVVGDLQQTEETSQATARLAQQAANTAQALQARLEETEGKVDKVDGDLQQAKNDIALTSSISASLAKSEEMTWRIVQAGIKKVAILETKVAEANSTATQALGMANDAGNYLYRTQEVVTDTNKRVEKLEKIKKEKNDDQ